MVGPARSLLPAVPGVAAGAVLAATQSNGNSAVAAQFPHGKLSPPA